MICLFGALMVAGVVGLVGLPLLRPNRRLLTGAFEEENALPELQGRKAVLIEAIKDLDFDFQTGKLSSQDHGLLRSQLKKKVFALYQETDELAEKGALSAEIEPEVSEIREKSGPLKDKPSSSKENQEK